MINIYSMKKGARILEKTEKPVDNCWINLVKPTEDEIKRVIDETGVSEEMLRAALDEEERARIETENSFTLVIIDTPIATKTEDNGTVYTTLPMGIIFSNHFFITVSLHENVTIAEFEGSKVRDFDLNKRTRFLYQILYKNAIKFLQHLRQIDNTSNKVQDALHRSMKNKELIQLLELEKALVYFSTSLNANQLVIDRLISISSLPHFEDDNNILDDVIIENKQAIEMATIYRDILSGTMDAFASVISNNQNTVMKFLTAITIILTIPTVLASLWGMNLFVPFAENPFGFYILLGIIVAIIVPLVVFMAKKNMF